MSRNSDQFKNPLIRDGVSQRQRQVASSALSPDFVKIDEWELADALVFAYQLSQKVQYYYFDKLDSKEKVGNWEAFFKNSAPVQIALISKTRPQSVKEEYDRQLQSFLEQPSQTPPNKILAFWKTDILRLFWQWYKKLESYTPLKSVIKGLIKTNLQESLIQLQAFERIYGEQSIICTESTRQIKLDDFVKEFWPESVTVPTDWNFLNVNQVTRKDELDAIFQKLFQTYRQIIQDAPKYLPGSISDRQDHPPHLALYLAFWEVMKPARDDLNLMTRRHLEFFYRKVLNLSEQTAEPDHAHLLFELAKIPNLTEFKLPLGTRFKAGKDAIGKELFYKLDEDIVVHKAKIASLKGLFLDKQDTLIRGVYASAIANSADGKGGAFPKEQLIKSWLPFGDKSRDPVSLGLAIASDVLLLKEGNRTITLTLTLRETIPESTPNGTKKFSGLTDLELKKLFQVKVSGKEKDWTEATITSVTRTSLYQLKLEIKLTADQSPLLPYRNTLPGAALPTSKPVLLLLLNPVLNPDGVTQKNDPAPYHYLRTLQLVDLTLETTVDQVRDLIIQNDLSILDANKPFQPFGSQPKAGNSLYVGSQEVFQKHLTKLSLDLKLERPKPKNWLEIYAAYDSAEDNKDPNEVKAESLFAPGRLTLQSLRERAWSSAITSNLFSNSGISLTPSELETLKLNSSVDSQPVSTWTNQTQNSFLRLQLSEGLPRSDFLHDEYPTVLARQMIAVANNTSVTVSNPSNPSSWSQKRKSVVGAYYRRQADKSIFKATTYYDADLNDEPIIPKEPYLPVIQSLSLAYSAIASKKDCTLYQLCPFDGFVELTTESPYLLTQFTDSGTLLEGELLIGLQDLDPPTALPLLFQVVEDSADTSLKKAEVNWFYLQDNTWRSLSDRIVSDTTYGLIASGIVHLGIPDDISKTQTTILDPTLYWIKASVAERSKAICQIINIHTQAAQVSFADQENDPNHLASSLAAGAIAKFEVPEANIKTVEQPYASFGGRPKELPEHFYLRVSERLRHKGRAVTIFDYERIVLEKFPEVYKVRCINHGLFNNAEEQLYELVPGAVTLAVIPDLSKRSTLKDLEPKVNINLLEKIEDYLASVSSSWVEIKVVNPKYEKVKIECQVKLRSPYDANFGYYRRELNQAITDFLAPWTRNIQAEIQFGGRLYSSAVLDFIEQLDYVDYLVDFKMNLDNQVNQVNVKEAIASTPCSVLTSGSSTLNQLFHQILEFKENMILPSQQRLRPNLLGYNALEQLTLE